MGLPRACFSKEKSNDLAFSGSHGGLKACTPTWVTILITISSFAGNVEAATALATGPHARASPGVWAQSLGDNRNIPDYGKILTRPYQKSPSVIQEGLGAIGGVSICLDLGPGF